MPLIGLCHGCHNMLGGLNCIGQAQHLNRLLATVSFCMAAAKASVPQHELDEHTVNTAACWAFVV